MDLASFIWLSLKAGMVSGSFPFGADLKDVTANALDFDLEFPACLSEDMVDLIGKMLRKDPAQRTDIYEVGWLQSLRRDISN
jgi:hypothetical protein